MKSGPSSQRRPWFSATAEERKERKKEESWNTLYNNPGECVHGEPDCQLLIYYLIHRAVSHVTWHELPHFCLFQSVESVLVSFFSSSSSSSYKHKAVFHLWLSLSRFYNWTGIETDLYLKDVEFQWSLFIELDGQDWISCFQTSEYPNQDIRAILPCWLQPWMVLFICVSLN